jgi:hypothetical protein
VFVVESSAVLAHAPETVYSALASVECLLRWQAGVHAVRRPAARPRGPLLLSYHALGARHRLAARVTAAEPPRLFAYRAEGPAFAYDATYRVEAAPGGARVGCRIVLTTGPCADVIGEGADPSPSSRPSRDDVALRRLLARRAVDDLTRLDRWIRARQSRNPPRAGPRRRRADSPA